MTIQFFLNTMRARMVWGVSVFIVGGIVVYFALLQFVLAVVTDPQIPVRRETLETATQVFPQSASIRARLAARLLEAGVSRNDSFEEVTRQAFVQASQAVSLTPWNMNCVS